jgi:hypothetical protein
MTWTSHQDDQTRCKEPPGAVVAGEELARLLHTKNPQPHQDPLIRTDLQPKKAGISNMCGESDGLSVVRCGGMSDADIRTRAEGQVAGKNDRQQEGAMIALVDDLRSIRQPGSEEQIVFAYDDPLTDDDFHAVLRVKQMPRPDFDEVRVLMADAFKRRRVTRA